MDVLIERVDGSVLILTVKEVDGEKYYCLADIMERLKLKSTVGGIKKDAPITITSKIIWGYRIEGNHYIESVFVDESCLNQLIQLKNAQI